MNIQILNKHTKPGKHRLFRKHPLLWGLFLVLIFAQQAWAEGTRKVAPNPQNKVMLEINRDGFGNFAAYGGPETSRLYFSISDPSEIVYLGFSAEHNNDGNQLLDVISSQYQFRIKREQNDNDPIVHGPFNINLLNSNVNNWNQAAYGNYLTNATQNGQKIYEFSPGQAGDYYIEFLDFPTGTDPNSKILIAYWDIAVTSGGAEVPGRVWSKNWAFRTPPIAGNNPEICDWDQEFNGTLFSYTSDGFVSKIDFEDSGFQGLSFNVAFNTRGPGTSGDVIEDRKSIPGVNATDNSAEHKIFLSEPDITLFPNGDCGEIFSDSIFNCATDTSFCLDVTVTRPGQVDIFIDFDRNGQFDPNSEDVNLAYNFTDGDLTTCVPWDGIKGNGLPAAFGDTVNIIFVYSQGVQNWAVYDAEVLSNGFCVESVRPTCNDALNTDLLYWDDSELPDVPGTGQPVDGRNGCQCGVDGCRTWTNFATNVADCNLIVDSLTTGYGDKNTLNTWWFANIIVVQTVNVPLLTCQIVGDTSICPSDSTTLTVEVSGTSSAFTYLWSGPGGVDGATTASVGPVADAGTYCVTVIDGQGCETVCCTDIIVLDGPSVTGSATDATCFSADDGSITLIGSGGIDTLMYSIDGVNFQESGVFLNLLPGDYTGIVTDGEGCNATVALTVGEVFDDAVEYQESYTICPGESVELTPTVDLPYIYEWFPITGLDDPNAPNPVASPTETTVYTAFITIIGTSDTCQFTRTVTVNVRPGPGLSVTGAGHICSQEATFEAAATGSNVSFAWLNTDGDTLQLGTTFETTVVDSVAYLLQGLDDEGCVQELLVTAVYDPVSIALPDTLSICEGEEFALAAVNLDPTDTLSYSWSPESSFTGGTDTATPDVAEVPGLTWVFLTTTNQYGCTNMDSVLLAVVDPDINLSFDFMLACDGSTVNFTNTSTDALGYLWDFGDGTTSTDTNPMHTYSMPGTYTITLSSLFEASCTQDVATAEVVIGDPQVAAGFTYDIVSCGLDSIQVQFMDNSTNTFNNDLSYEWIFSNGETSMLANPLITVATPGPLSVTLTITTENDCTNSTTETLIFEFIDFSVADTLVRCPGSSLELNPGGNTSYTYDWSPATGLSATDIANPIATPDQTTTYTVTVENISADTCSYTQEITVIVPEEIDVDGGADQTTCGEAITLTATSNPAVELDSLYWTLLDGSFLVNGATVEVDPDSLESYVVVAMDSFGCVDMDTVTVVSQEVNVSMPDDIISCDPFLGMLSIQNLDPNDILTYSWTPLANIISGANTASPTVEVVQGTVVFTVEITNQFNCTLTETISLTAGVVDIGLPDTLTVCPGSEAMLNPGGSASFTYVWMPATGLDDPTSNNPTFIGTENTTYIVTVSDNSTGVNCEIIDTVAVVIGPVTILDITNDTTICEEGPFNLAQLAPGYDNVSWFDNADLTPPAIGTGDPVLVNLSAGSFTYYAAIIDSLTCSDTVLVNLEVTNFNPGIIGELDTIRVCAGYGTPLNPDGNPNYTYTWSPTDGLDLTEPWNPIVEVTMDQTYSVTVVDPVSGCDLETEVYVEAVTEAGIELPNDTAVCFIGDYVLTATTEVLAPINWYANDNFDPLFSMGNSTLVTLVEGENTFWAIAGEGTGCADTASVTITATDFQPGLELDTMRVCAGYGTPLNPNGNPAYSYTWSPTDGLDLTEPWNPIVEVTMDQLYAVTVVDPLSGCDLETEVYVEAVTEAGIELPNDTAVCFIGDYTLTATTDVVAPINWYATADFDPLLGMGNSITVTLVEGENIFWAIAGEGTGCADTASVTIMATDFQPGLELDTVRICAGYGTPLNPNGNPAYTYTWSPTTGLDLTEPWNPIVELTMDQLYAVTVVDPVSGCDLETEVYVEAVTEAGIELPNDTAICFIGDYTLTATTEVEAPINWYADANFTPLLGMGNSIMVTLVEGENTFWAIAGEGTGCADTSSVTIMATDFQPGLELDTVRVCAGYGTPLNPNGNPAYTYTWSPTDGLDLTEPWNPIVEVTMDQLYAVTVVDPVSGCDLETEVYVEAVTEAGIELPNDTTVCFIGNYTLTATTEVEAPINWYADDNFDPLLGMGNSITVSLEEGENIFWAIAGEGTGCADTSSVTITATNFDSGLADTTINVCIGLPTPIFVDANPNYTYEWSPADGLILNGDGLLEVTALVEQTYMITVTDGASGCMDEFEVTIIPVTEAGIELPNDTAVCFIGDYTLEATTDVFAPVVWYDNPNFTPPSIGSGNSITVTLIEGENMFWAIAGEGTGCADTASVTIMATDFQPGLEMDTVRVCAGYSTPLNPNGNPNYTYTWSPTDGLDLTEPWNPIVEVTMDQLYSVTVVDPISGCELQTDVYVEAVTEAGIELTNDTSVCFIGDFVLNATTEVDAPINWYADENFNPVLGTGNSITVTLVEGENIFWAIAGEGTGCADTASVTINATDFQPVVSDTTINVCSGFPTPIFIGTNPDYTYEWSPVDGIVINGDGQLEVTAVVDQTYMITVTDPISGCTNSFEVEIIPVTEAGIELPNDTSVCFIGDYELTATTDVTAPIAWYDNPDFTPPAIGMGNTITVTLVEGENTFWAIAGEGTGCADTASITITATDFQPGLEDGLLNICANTPTPINPNGNPDYTYTWSPTDGLIFGDPWNPSIFTTTDQVYSVTVTDPASGCELTSTVEVTVITPIIELTASDDITVCDTIPVELNAMATGDGVGINWYDDVTLTAPPIGSGNSITVTPEFGDNIIVVVAEDINGCMDSIWIHINAINGNSGIVPELTACEGDAVPLNANGNPNLVYSWSPPELLDDPTAVNPTVVLTEDATFTVMISDSTNTCMSEETVAVTILPTIGLEAMPDTAVLCMLESVTFTASTAVDDADISWYLDLDGDPVGTGPSITVEPMVDTVYYVLASYGGACAELDSVIVFVSEIQAELTAPQTFCEPVEVVELVVQNFDLSQDLTYEWEPAAAILSGAGGPIVTVDPNISENFSVTITNENGCSEVLSTTVTVIDLANDLTISADPDTIFLGNESQLLVEGCDDCTFSWSPAGTLDLSDVADPIALPDQVGTVTYTVIIEKGGCSQTLSIDLEVRELFCTGEYIFLPDAFTPNNDNVNDVLYVRSNNITEMELMIYNRWGERVFRSNDINVGWDGTFKGDLLPPDVYGFYLKALCPNGEEFVKKGNVTLLR